MAKKGARPALTPHCFFQATASTKKHITYCGRGNVFCFAFIHTALSLVEAAGLADWALWKVKKLAWAAPPRSYSRQSCLEKMRPPADRATIV
ncbi:hypothetical protein TYRP_019674 [Tyrophagus putrescentiae]|nr:hypothetical protein TYRP_019674 [Tyrophagus putrescentiae]